MIDGKLRQHYTVDRTSCSVYRTSVTAKRGYKTKQLAEEVIKKVNNPTLNVYQCSICGQWHIGTNRYAVRKK